MHPLYGLVANLAYKQAYFKTLPLRRPSAVCSVQGRFGVILSGKAANWVLLLNFFKKWVRKIQKLAMLNLLQIPTLLQSRV
jgi:hypothetical protein